MRKLTLSSFFIVLALTVVAGCGSGEENEKQPEAMAPNSAAQPGAAKPGNDAAPAAPL